MVLRTMKDKEFLRMEKIKVKTKKNNLEGKAICATFFRVKLSRSNTNFQIKDV